MVCLIKSLDNTNKNRKVTLNLETPQTTAKSSVDRSRTRADRACTSWGSELEN